MIERGTVWWVDLGEPTGSEPALARPAVVISADAYNRSTISTVVVVVLTSNLRLGNAPGNIVLVRGTAGLPKVSVVNVTQIATVDKASLLEQIGTLDEEKMDTVSAGLRRALDLSG